MKRICIGVDPGQSGGYAAVIIREDGTREAWAHEWSREGFVADMAALAREGITFAAVERVGAMPGQGVRSTFTFGEGYGFIQGALSALMIPFDTVPPKVWKKAYSLGNDKAASIACAHRLFPGVSLRRSARCVKDHDGMAEALLIAAYAQRMGPPMPPEPERERAEAERMTERFMQGQGCNRAISSERRFYGDHE